MSADTPSYRPSQYQTKFLMSSKFNITVTDLTFCYINMVTIFQALGDLKRDTLVGDVLS